MGGVAEWLVTSTASWWQHVTSVKPVREAHDVHGAMTVVGQPKPNTGGSLRPTLRENAVPRLNHVCG